MRCGRSMRRKPADTGCRHPMRRGWRHGDRMPRPTAPPHDIRPPCGAGRTNRATMENWKKTFAVIWSGQMVSILSSAVVGYAVIFWMSLETGSAEVLALAAIAGILPQSLLGPVVGVYVDRWDRRRTMILADSFIALCTLLLALLFRLGIAQMWHIYILLACRSVGSAFHTPAMQASVPLLAPASQAHAHRRGQSGDLLALGHRRTGSRRPAAHRRPDRRHPPARRRGRCGGLHLAALRADSPPRPRPGTETRPAARVPRRIRRHARHAGHGLVLRLFGRRMVFSSCPSACSSRS